MQNVREDKHKGCYHVSLQQHCPFMDLCLCNLFYNLGQTPKILETGMLGGDNDWYNIPCPIPWFYILLCSCSPSRALQTLGRAVFGLSSWLCVVLIECGSCSTLTLTDFENSMWAWSLMFLPGLVGRVQSGCWESQPWNNSLIIFVESWKL